MMNQTIYEKLLLNIIYSTLYDQERMKEATGDKLSFYFNLETCTVQEKMEWINDVDCRFIDINVTVNSETFEIEIDEIDNENYTEIFGFLKIKLPRLPLFAILIKLALLDEALANYIYTNFTNDKNSFHSQLDESLKRVYAKHDIIMSCINDYCKTTGIDNTTVIKLLNKTYIDIAEDMLFAINQRVDYINSGENLLKLLNMPINWFSYQRQ